jgi:hypothetical protein
VLSLGEDATVLGPRSLQTHIRDLGAKIVSTYLER